jgi:hypothetical protein
VRKLTRLEVGLRAKTQPMPEGARDIGEVMLRVFGCSRLGCRSVAYELSRDADRREPDCSQVCGRCERGVLQVREVVRCICEVNAKQKIARVRRFGVGGKLCGGWVYIPFLSVAKMD